MYFFWFLFFARERDQYESRVVELDRKVTQDELQMQTQTKEKENLFHQVYFKYLFSM